MDKKVTSLGRKQKAVSKLAANAPAGKTLTMCLASLQGIGTSAIESCTAPGRAGADGMEQSYRNLIDVMPDAIWVLSNDRFKLANTAAADLFGVSSPDGLIGKNIVTFFRKSARPEIEERLRKQNERTLPVPRKEERKLRLKRGDVDVEISVSEFVYGGENAVMVIARDIGLRKRAETLLRQAEERFSKAFHGSPAASSISKFAGTFIDVNRAFLKMFGFRREEVIDHNILELKMHIHPRNRQKLIEKLRREKSISEYEITLRTKVGWPIDVMESIELIELGGEKCLLTTWEDITSRKRLEKEILDISEREQSRMGQDLHDGVCQSLAGLAFLAEGLSKNLAQGLVPRDQAAKDARWFAKSVRDVIDEAHNLATGLYPVRVEENGLISGLHELASDTSQRYSVKCIFDGDEDVRIPNNAVATHLYRIAQEAVSNSIKHGHASLVEIRLEGVDGQVTLGIQDNGRGIVEKKTHPGMGLKTMSYRARMIGGFLEIKPLTSPRKGTLVKCTYANE